MSLSARFAVRMLFATALLSGLFFFKLVDFSNIGVLFRRPGTLILIELSCIAALLIAGVRWHRLLHAQGQQLGIAKTVGITFVGAFFSTFLPGVGGDIVRGIYIYDASLEKRTSTILSIFVDRIVALTAFVLGCAGASLLRPFNRFSYLEYTILLAAAGLVGSVVALFSIAYSLRRFRIPRSSSKPTKIASLLQRLADTLDQYTLAWPQLLAAFAVSMVAVLLVAVGIAATAGAMRIGALSFFDYALAGIYAIVLNSLPLTPGGLGVGESAFASACLALSPTATELPFATVFLAYRCLTAISTLPGLIVYLLYPRQKLRAAA